MELDNRRLNLFCERMFVAFRDRSRLVKFGKSTGQQSLSSSISNQVLDGCREA
jgi:hypothetical protein